MEGALQEREVEKRALYTAVAVGRVLERDCNLLLSQRVGAGKGHGPASPGHSRVWSVQ